VEEIEVQGFEWFGEGVEEIHQWLYQQSKFSQ
jgi:hypothetical protein